MMFARFVLAGLWRRWGSTALTLLIGACGLAGLILILWAQTALPEAVKARISETDMVVGPKASGLDLSLCCALHQTPAPGLVSLNSVEARLSEPDLKPYIRASVPIALGDSVEGIRIVWTRPDIVGFYHARLAKGRLWAQPMQMVAGAQAAKTLNLRLGQTLGSSHGLAGEGEAHAARYTVTGILAPTGGVIDHLLLSDLGSIARVHTHGPDADDHDHAEATDGHHVNAVLVSFTSPVALAAAPALINQSDTLSAASPQLELARLLSLVRPVIYFAAGLFVAIGAFGALVLTLSLVQALNRRARDLTLLRFMGATSLDLSLICLAEALLIVHAALVLGVGLSLLGQSALTHVLTTYGLSPRPGLPVDQWPWLYVAALLTACLSALVPALRLALTREDEGFRA